MDDPSLAASLGGLDPDVAEAAALAHDLGHPPHGHIAEEEINEVARANGLEDGFEGNAQSLRIVGRLDVGDGVSVDGPAVSGLNLTRATLCGILKYPWLCERGTPNPKKWGAYESERDIFEWARQGSPGGFTRTLEAEIMDYADDITYAVHDLTDFLCAGQIPFDSLRIGGLKSVERQMFYDDVFRREPKWIARRSELEQYMNDAGSSVVR